MKNSLLACCLLLVGVGAAFGQEQPKSVPPSEMEINGRIGMLQQQRDTMSNSLVVLAGQMAELTAKLAEAKQAASACVKSVSEKKEGSK